MIVVDVNLLLYAYDTTAPDHERARRWLEDVFFGKETVGLPWQSISAFIRILSHPNVPGQRFSFEQVIAIVDEWLEVPHVRALAPGEGYWTQFREMLVKGDARGKLTSDAALAALTIEYGGVLYTNDRDFARFPGLRWVNPLRTE